MARNGILTCCWIFWIGSLCGTNAAVKRCHGYLFEAYVVDSHGHRIPERSVNGQATLFVKEGDEYSIVIHNPLPVRAGVAISVDGLNSVDGRRTTPADASKWIVNPQSSLVIRGWQTGHDKLRRFVFVRKESSYAEWKSKRDSSDYVRNLGVIGVAWFWNSRELAEVVSPCRPFSPVPDQNLTSDKSLPSVLGTCASRGMDSPGSSLSDQQAGTGMGRQERNDVERVHFEFDMGMYSTGEVLTIYYEFVGSRALPTPFSDESSEGFAPDMHSRSSHRP